jgi:hypothetical protein
MNSRRHHTALMAEPVSSQQPKAGLATPPISKRRARQVLGTKPKLLRIGVPPGVTHALLVQTVPALEVLCAERANGGSIARHGMPTQRTLVTQRR